MRSSHIHGKRKAVVLLRFATQPQPCRRLQATVWIVAAGLHFAARGYTRRCDWRRSDQSVVVADEAQSEFFAVAVVPALGQLQNSSERAPNLQESVYHSVWSISFSVDAILKIV